MVFGSACLAMPLALFHTENAAQYFQRFKKMYMKISIKFKGSNQRKHSLRDFSKTIENWGFTA